MTGCDGWHHMAVLKTIVSLYRAGEEKPIERYKTRVKVAEENKLFSSFQKEYYQVSWAQRASSKVLTWNFTVWRKSMAKRRITPYQHSSNPRVNCRFQPGGGMLVDFYSISLKWRRMLYISASSGKVCFIVNGYFVAFRDLMLLESRQRLFSSLKTL